MGFSKYPKSLDDGITLPVSIDLITSIRAEVVNRLRDAIIATQTELGTDPSSSFGTVKARLDDLATQISTQKAIGDKTLGIQTDLDALEIIVTALSADFTTHESNVSNPHAVTAAQVGSAAIVNPSTNSAIIRFNGTSGQMQDAPLGPFMDSGGRFRLAETSDPALVVNNGFIYTKDVSGNTQLFFKDSAGVVTQLTSGGGSAVDIVIADNIANAFRIREASNDYLNIDTTDGTEIILLGNPTTDPEIQIAGAGGLQFQDSIANHTIDIAQAAAETNAANFFLTAGAGGATAGVAVGGTGGIITVTGGPGGAGNAAQVGGLGGIGSFGGGTGGAGDALQAAGAGGTGTLSGGRAGAANSGVGGDGGTSNVVGGVATGSAGNGGVVNITGGSNVTGGNSGTGGQINITGGISIGSGDAGDIVINGGNAIGGGADGSIFLGSANTTVIVPGVNIAWDATTITPTLSQAADAGSDATGELLTINSQDVTGAGTTITGGALLVRAGDASGSATNDVGGALTLQSGVGTTSDGEVTIQKGTALNLVSTDASDNIFIGDFTPASGDLFLDTRSDVSFRIAGGGTIFSCSASNFNIRVTNLSWSDNIATPTLFQDNDTNDDATGDLMTIRAQGVTGGGTTNIGGALLIHGGDAVAGTATNETGGALTIRSGRGGTGTGTHGAVLLSSGTDADTEGRALIYYDEAVADQIEYGGTGGGGFTRPLNVVLDASSLISLNITTNVASFSSTAFNLAVPALAWTNSVVAPEISQADDTGASSTAETMTIRAQIASGITSTGGDLALYAGTGTSVDGATVIYDADGVTSRITVDGDEDIIINWGVGRTCQFTQAGSQVADFAGSQIILYQSTFTWSEAPTGDAPIITQASTSTNDATGDPMVVRAQEVSGAGTATTGGSLTLAAGESSGAPTTGTGGTATLIGGSSSGATTSIGGAAIVQAGAGSDTDGVVEIRSGDGIDRINISGVGDLTFDPALVTVFRTSGVYRFAILASEVDVVVPLFSFRETVTSPIIRQDNDTTADATGDAMLIHAQDVTGGGTTITGGALTIRAGTASGAATNDVGGALAIRAGSGTTTNGVLTLEDANSTARFTIGATGDTTIDGTTQLLFQTAAATRAQLTSTNLRLSVTTLDWSSTVVSPIFTQDDETGAGVSGDAMLIHAQDSTGTGTKSGGALTVRAGDASGGTDTGGALSLSSGSGDTDGILTLDVGGTPRLTINAAGTLIEVDVTSIAFDSDVDPPIITQTSSTAAGDDLTIQAQETTGTSVAAGDTIILGGQASGGTNASGGNVQILVGAESGSGTKGSISLIANASSYQSGEGISFVGDATTVPTGNPSSGGFMYAESGAGKWRGSSGTVTTFGPADPRCPKCGLDYVLESENQSEGWHKVICINCMIGALTKAGVDPSEYVMKNIDTTKK